MGDIDWLAVEMTVQGTRLALNRDEKLMAIRRLEHRMLAKGESDWLKLSAGQLAERLQICSRTVERLWAELPMANKVNCPVCREPMWAQLDGGVVEPHPDRMYDECPMSGQQMLRGLAAVRPDLYGWVVAS